VLTPLDIALLVTLLGLSVIGFVLPAHHSGGEYVVVEREGSEICRVPLDVERTVEVYGKLGRMEIRIEGGRARVVQSPCPLKLCVSSGPIGTSGQMIVCIPNAVVVRIEGEGGFDAVLR